MLNLFKPVPAYRFATFRFLIALTTLFVFIPNMVDKAKFYTTTSFHVPIFSLPVPGGKLLFLVIPVLWLAGFVFLLGYKTRLAAWILLLVGTYIFCLDIRNYSHNSQFHMLLLFIFAVSPESISLKDLVRQKRNETTIDAWPEWLVLWQVGIVFFYAAVDKVYSPFWGLQGSFFVLQTTQPMDWIRALHPEIFSKSAGLMSLTAIVMEFLIAFVFLFRIQKTVILISCLFFIMGLEILEKPMAFAWDSIACMLLLLPAPSKTYPIQGPFWLKYLDWFRQVQWTEGKIQDFRSLIQIIKLLPAPILALFIWIRFDIHRFHIFGDKTGDFLPIFMALPVLLWFLLLGLTSHRHKGYPRSSPE